MKQYIKQLNQFAIPLIANFAAAFFMEVTDEAIIARVSTSAFTGVSLVNGFIHMIAGVLGCVTIIFNTRGAKEWGAKNEDGLKEEWNSSLFLCFLLGSIFAAIMLLGSDYILRGLYGLRGETLGQAKLFAFPMSFYVLVQLLLFAYGTYFRIRNITKWVFWGSTVASILDLGLDYLFVYGAFGLPRLGAAMVGWSTILALCVNLVMYVFFLKQKDFFRFLLTGFISNDPRPVSVATKFFVFFIAAHSISVVSYIYKSSLQALEQFDYIFKITVVSGLITLIAMWILTGGIPLGLFGIAAAQLLNGILTGIIYMAKYRKAIGKVS